MRETNPVVLPLPEVLDAKDAAPLLSALLAARGKPVEIDASRVRRIGMLGLRVLISARIAWAADDVSLRILNPSDVFCDAVAFAGVSLDPVRQGCPAE